MIRHENIGLHLRASAASQTIKPLAVPVVKPTFATLLMPTIILAPLLPPGLLSAPLAAIRLASVAM